MKFTQIYTIQTDLFKVYDSIKKKKKLVWVTVSSFVCHRSTGSTKKIGAVESIPIQVTKLTTRFLELYQIPLDLIMKSLSTFLSLDTNTNDCMQTWCHKTFPVLPHIQRKSCLYMCESVTSAELKIKECVTNELYCSDKKTLSNLLC